MMEIYTQSYPVLTQAEICNENLIIEYEVDELWVDPDTNEYKVLSKKYEEVFPNEIV